MKKLLIVALLTMIACATMADNNDSIMGSNGKIIPMPKYGSTEANTITPRKNANYDIKTRVIGQVDPSYIPHKGNPKILVILTNFKDVKFRVNNPKKAFEDFFNSESGFTDYGNGNKLNYGSVKQYFEKMSSNSFSPKFDVHGPINLPDVMKVYGGSSTTSNYDEKISKLVQDALSQLNDSIKDASEYDSDGDGYIDCVCIVSAYVGQNNGGTGDCVWACTGTSYGTFGGKNVGWYSLSSELYPAYVDTEQNIVQINSIGVACHELSHALGLPDIYPISPSAHVDNQEMELWDLMDGGEYANNGYTPTPYTAWEKMQMGWNVDIVDLSNNKTITMDKTTEEGGTVYKIKNSKNSNEYFLIENIQQTGWNSGAMYHGLQVYHVNDPADNNILINTHLNETPNKPGMGIVPADGNSMSSYLKTSNIAYEEQHKGDLFPGTSNITVLNDTLGLPNFYWYTQDTSNAKATFNTNYYKVNKAIKNITEKDGVITFDYINDFTTNINNIYTDENNKTTRIYTIDGRYVGDSISSLQRGIYIINKKKLIIK
jgi:M6 family metalloprotease domain